MRFGYFDDEAREYVITTPHTPRPWINYLGTESFFSLVSGSQGGYSFYRDAKLRRLTRYRYNGVPADDNGRYLFIHDGTDVWSPSYAPCRVELDEYECRHGLGYTTVTGARNGVRVVRTTCVPRGADAEISRVVVTNLSTATKTLQLFTFVEFCLWDALDDQMNYQRNLSLAEVEIEGSAIYHKTEYRERRNHYAVFWVNKPIAGFDTDRDTFIGPERPLSAAVVPATGRAANSVVSGWYPIGSHQVDLTLAPGESTSFIVGLGYVENPTDKWEQGGPRGQGKWLPLWQGETPRVNKVPAHALMARFATDDQFDVALAELRSYFSDRLAHCTVRSADPRFDRTVNVWNPYQCLVTFNLSRSASYFETGIGRGMG
ncbi:MAG: hypothetical protein LBI33_03230, partial [Propionibacteriaceae bacterium]|nr:hypothetical protein [Propionibacteriaceae bacterium]